MGLKKWILLLLILFVSLTLGCNGQSEDVDTVYSYAKSDDLSPHAWVYDKDTDTCRAVGAYTYIRKISGSPVSLKVNPDAEYAQLSDLWDFLLKDDTDSLPYSDSSFVCLDFAERLQNNAERDGIRSGLVSVRISRGIDHALTFFITEDGSYIFVDAETDNYLIGTLDENGMLQITDDTTGLLGKFGFRNISYWSDPLLRRFLRE